MVTSALANQDTLIRLQIFAAILVVMAAWEMGAPRRSLSVPRRQRWLPNLSLVALDATLLRLLIPAGAAGAAMAAGAHGWGLLNLLDMPAWAAVAAAVVMLDFIIYTQHVVFHAVPLLWRLHMVHHADTDIDVSTGLRFHPLEILLSMLIKMAAVILLGAPVFAVFVFEVLLNGMAMFNHGNVRLPGRLDAALRLLIVTPDMHRVHHSVLVREMNSNYGFNLSWWDRLFGTYRARPADGHQAMAIGLPQFQRHRHQGLWWLLRLPFTRRALPAGRA